MNILRILAASILLPACAICATARLYDIKTGEVILAKYSKWEIFLHTHGKVSATLKSGQVLTGEFSAVREDVSGWGSIYSSVYGNGGFASGSSYSQFHAASNVARGSGVLVGEGKIIDCEYVASAGHGSGACKDNEGRFYRLIF
jgi:hypothetical protein